MAINYSIFEDDFPTQGATQSKVDWAPIVGKWHEARIVALANLGWQETTWKGVTKKQQKVSLHMILDEMVEIDGKLIPKSRCERFTVSISENSGLMTRIINNISGLKVSKLRDLLGVTLRIKLKKEGEYVNLGNVDDAENPLQLPDGVYVPKWWLQTKEGVSTGYEIVAEEGVNICLLPVEEKITIEKHDENIDEGEGEDALPF